MARCTTCHGKRFVWVLKSAEKWHIIPPEDPYPDAQMEVCPTCLGAGELGCCDGPVCTEDDERAKKD